jgi:hypothetical protein
MQARQFINCRRGREFSELPHDGHTQPSRAEREPSIVAPLGVELQNLAAALRKAGITHETSKNRIKVIRPADANRYGNRPIQLTSNYTLTTVQLSSRLT